MAERTKAPVSKTGIPSGYRGFESHSLRQVLVGISESRSSELRTSPYKFHRKGVYAVPGVGWRQALSHEYVAQVAATVNALNLNTHPVGVGQVLYSARNFLIKGRPAAMGVKFIFGAV